MNSAASSSSELSMLANARLAASAVERRGRFSGLGLSSSMILRFDDFLEDEEGAEPELEAPSLGPASSIWSAGESVTSFSIAFLS